MIYKYLIFTIKMYLKRYYNTTVNDFWKINSSKKYDKSLTNIYKVDLNNVDPQLVTLFMQGDQLIKRKHNLDKRTLADQSLTLQSNINVIIDQWLQSGKNSQNIKYAYDNLISELKIMNNNE